MLGGKKSPPTIEWTLKEGPGRGWQFQPRGFRLPCFRLGLPGLSNCPKEL